MSFIHQTIRKIRAGIEINIWLILFIFVVTCTPDNSEIRRKSDPDGSSGKATAAKTDISREMYRNKVLGMLVGSAIGDAMGAPTEMWNRKDILLEYGYVDDLDTMVRSPSPEGTWKYNLPAGGSTDDTRWKKMMVEYSLTQSWPDFSPFTFASKILSEYNGGIDLLSKTKNQDPGTYEDNMLRITFLQEWAAVAKPFVEKNIIAYSNALNRFYGGEMTCAGMLYSPVIGACIPEDPEKAYDQAYNLAIFDIGYARDLTGLTAAMTSAAFMTGREPDIIVQAIRDVDPAQYFKSRLVGRAAYRFFRKAREIVFRANQLKQSEIDPDFESPSGWEGRNNLSNFKMMNAFSMLDDANEDMPFHPGEIFLTVLTAMMYSDYDFQKTMQFIVNYGRDNDTAAAVAGAILGAYYGAEALPADQVEKSISVNRELLGIDLQDLSEKMTDKMFN